MDTYSFLRELADSWALLVLTLIFLGVIAWAFRPGSRPLHDDAAAVPFREREPSGCANACPDCTCAVTDFMKERDHV
ncbi:cbb3-type cytochrome c oxidase subunit 3 [Jannaschia pohangensis]|uniref:Cbb3-type cytochrome oxidase component FixQ n=1 Tax=Jannaschia pohangensis TaxID=390807 RepID=A0A1I3SK54_9RHOB|nr:cbb3-type cytochrome c oxidase subunit 3 [Jannaschia pohangensis]SFJ57826.1 Cbb3-type cytochrome oxidase component FixQ [Jannaschia pohangensis]